MRTRITTRLIKELAELGCERTYWEDFDFSKLKLIPVRTKKNKQKTKYADVIIMADTETSKSETSATNHVCMWSLAMRCCSINVCCIWGFRPSDLMKAIYRIKEIIICDELYIYIQNLSYDWVFLRKFFFASFSTPTDQLNTKPLYPISIKFNNGIILKDSLCLSQRSLEKWGKDMQVEHAKAVGKWDYNLIRNYDDWKPTGDEILYATNDVLCGVECIDATMKAIRKTVTSIPLTATGIPRGESRLIGRKNRAHDWFLKLAADTYSMQQVFEWCFHGGYTHENRYVKGITFPCDYPCKSTFPKCKDFSSSYPYNVLVQKFPAEKFWLLTGKIDADYIERNSENYAFIFHLKVTDLDLKDAGCPMPAISHSKCLTAVNALCDNGRVICADYLDIWLTEMDFKTIYEQYKGKFIFETVYCARKDYLPRWFTDYIYKLYQNKTQLKGVDSVLYAIEKAKLNAASFGMCAQKPVKPEIVEDYETGTYSIPEDFDYETQYQKYLKNRNSFLPYCIGVYITAYAQYNLFQLGKCVPKDEVWLYSDTDSVYATGFDEAMVEAYNKECIRRLEERGYSGVEFKGKIYYPGVAEDDGTCMQFKALHSKCYVKRPLTAYGDNFVMGEDLKITVAGVPKRGAKCLHNNIENFKVGFCFDGETSGKLQHEHIFIDEIYVDEHGNECGDSINLTPCSYIVNDPNTVDWDEFLTDEVQINDYEYESEE